MKRVLIFGRDGQVGHELHRLLTEHWNVHAVDVDSVSFTNAKHLRETVRHSQPEIIINAAAYTAVDQAEDEPDLAHQINCEASRILAQEANQSHAALIHFSTDYVFDGQSRTPYTESATPNPLNVYGQTKWLGDQAVQNTAERYMIFRLCWVYGLRGRNFFLTMLRLFEKGDPISVVKDQIGSPSWAQSIAQSVSNILYGVCQKDPELTRNTWATLNGTYHLACRGETSWFGFAKRIAQLTSECQQRPVPFITPITTCEYPTKAKRPSYSVLDCGKIQQTFGLTLPTWEEALDQVCHKRGV